jgi:hypothetical protein
MTGITQHLWSRKDAIEKPASDERGTATETQYLEINFLGKDPCSEKKNVLEVG